MKLALRKTCLFVLLFSVALDTASGQQSAQPGSRTVMDAHNCYPYFEWWADRIDRALSTGTPLAIEQDLYWYTDPRARRSWSVVAHGDPVSGQEPTLEQYFFERVRPLVEAAFQSGNRRNWPLITLNLDFKTEERQHLEAIWSLLSKYRAWLTSAPRSSDGAKVEDLDIKPILVLTGDSDIQQLIFHDHVPIGERLLLFGAMHTNTKNPMAAPQILVPGTATNYRRWWNNPWSVVERGGQTQAGEWTAEDALRLRALVEYAHSHGLWIRLYTLDGASNEDLSCHGWFRSYNFGSLSAAQQRWQAAKAAGVDYVASDQYEALADLLKRNSE